METKIEVINIESMCRTCLRTDNNLVSIYDEVYSKIPLYSILLEYTNTQVSRYLV